MTVNGSFVTDAVVALLRAEMGVPVGDGEIPVREGLDVEALRAGYVIVSSIPAGARYGQGHASPESIELLRFQVTGHGAVRRQAERIASAAFEILLGRAGGVFVHEISPAGCTVLDRYGAGKVPTDRVGSFQSGYLVDLLCHG